VLSEDTMFSIDLGEGGTCFVEPREMRVEADCEGLDPAALPLPVVPDSGRVIAYGIMRGPGKGSDRRYFGVVAVLSDSVAADGPPDQATADTLAKGVAAGVAKHLPPATHLLPPTAKLVSSRNAPVVRATIAISGIEAGNVAELDAHRELVAVVASGAVYVATWVGRPSDALELARRADLAAATVVLRAEARPTPRQSAMSAELAMVGVIVLLPLLLFALKHRSRAKREPT
jgi:hypothetical protein